MATFLVRRLIGAIITLILALSIAFVLGKMSGDPVYNILGPFAERSQIASMKHELGLDRPVISQYFTYIGNVFTGHLGNSLEYDESNLTLIESRLPDSAELLAAGMVLALIGGVALGIVAAVHEGRLWDRTASSVALLGQSVPVFWLGLMLVLIFGVELKWLPAGEAGGINHLILPAVTLSLFPLAQIARLTRSSMSEALHEPYIDAARARGLSSTRVVGLHALKNAAIPVVTITGIQAGTLLSGAVAVEYVFAWPGVGTAAINAVEFHDYTLIQAIVILGAVLFVVINFVVDIICALVDPRIRQGVV
jgi:peptide/nickel transport system permease protein